MNNGPIPNTGEQAIDAIMRDELAHGDATLSTIGPIMGHLLASPGASLFSEETVARVRGMIHDLARQLIIAKASAAGAEKTGSFGLEEADILARQLGNDEPLVMHCHALAMECEIAIRLERDSAIDPILSPLLQHLIASQDDAVSSLAMAAMAAQARFSQQVRRMQLPYTELPVDLFDGALLQWKGLAGGADSPVMDKAESALRQGFDQQKSRATQLDRLLASIREQANEALSVREAGAALFVTALSRMTGRGRDRAVQWCNESQFARLALALRSAGLSFEKIEQQFAHLHPEIVLPDGFADLAVDQARQLLSSGGLDEA